MQQSELEAKLSSLREIQPRQEWVTLTRQKFVVETAPAQLQRGRFSGILNGIASQLIQYLERPALVIPVLALLVSGGAVWHQAQGSLPGDAFYAVKSAVQEVPLRFSDAEEKPLLQLELAKRRLADLRLVAEQNKVRNLLPAIEAFEQDVAEVSGTVAAIVENQPENALQAGRRIVQLQKEKSEVEQILGTKIGEAQEAELANAARKVVEYELADLETRSLEEVQQELFAEARVMAAEGNYAAALEIIWELYQEG